MSTVWLMFVMCTGQACEVVELPTHGTPYGCALTGQALAAAWIAEHSPGAELRRWRCQFGRPA